MAIELDRIARDTAGCRACELWEPATETVFGACPHGPSFVRPAGEGRSR